MQSRLVTSKVKQIKEAWNEKKMKKMKKYKIYNLLFNNLVKRGWQGAAVKIFLKTFVLKRYIVLKRLTTLISNAKMDENCANYLQKKCDKLVR